MPDQPVLHRRTFAADGDLHLRVLVAGWSEIGDWWHGRQDDPPFWRLYVNDRDGAEAVLADGRVVALAAGSAWLLPAGLAYANRTRARAGQVWIHFDPVGLSPGGLRATVDAPIAIALDPGLRGAATALQRAALDPAGSDLALRCLAKGLVYLALARWWEGLAPALRARLQLAVADPALAPAFARIAANLAAPLYNEALARACRLSPSAFVRRFRSACGMSPAQFVLERRIAQAAERLVLEDAAIEDIADQGGFSDRYYFTRVFTRRMGVSPAAYRAQHPAAARAPEPAPPARRRR